MPEFLITMGVTAFLEWFKRKDPTKMRKFRNIAVKAVAVIEAAYNNDPSFQQDVAAEKVSK